MDIVPRREASYLDKPVTAGTKGVGKVAVNEIYLDGRLKKAELINENNKSFGIFMHSLILSNYAEVMKVNNNEPDVVGDEFEKAIFYYTAAKGFDKKLFDSIAPRMDKLEVAESHLKASTHLINEKMRIVSKGTPYELLNRCSYILLDSKIVKLTRRIMREVNDVLRGMLNRCVSVYAIAIKDVSSVSRIVDADACVNGMTLVSLVGMGRA